MNNAPPEAGLYALGNNLEWILVAETTNIRDSLLTHLKAVDGPVKLRNPTGFMFEVGSHGSMAARRQALVAQLRPACVVMEPTRQTSQQNNRPSNRR